MGKLIYFLTVLIFVDLLFISTGQLCASGTCSLGSVVFNAALNLVQFDGSSFFGELIGDILNLFGSATGIGSLLVATGVIVGSFFARPSDMVLMIPIAFTLAVVSADFVFIYSYLASINFLLATIIMAPLIIIYTITIIDWLRARD